MKISITVPALNEEAILEKNLLRIFDFCDKNLSIEWEVVIVDNGSTDKTFEIGNNLATKYDRIKYIHIDARGKGIAIKTGWKNSAADIYCFMDADLATDLSALPVLINEFENGFDLVVGSRFHKDSRVARSRVRKFFSAGYRMVLKILLGLKIQDAPCGFKAINNKVKQDVLPQVKDDKWFFDSELLILAEHAKLRIKEIPVLWSDPRTGDDKSRVQALSLSIAYFKQALAMYKRLK